MVKVAIVPPSTTPPAATTGPNQPRLALAALCALVAVAPFNLALSPSDDVLPIWLRPLLPLQLGLCALILITAPRRRDRSRQTARRPALVGVVLVAAVSLSAVLSDDRLAGMGGMAAALALALTVVATAVTVRDATDGQRLLRWMVGGATAGAGVGLVVLANGGDLWFTEFFVGTITRIGLTPRLTRPWSHANIAAMALAPTATIVATVVLSGRAVWHRYVDAIVLVLLVIATALTYSRGGMVALVVGVAVAAVVLMTRFDISSQTVLPQLAGIVVLVAVAGFGIAGDRLAGAGGPFDDRPVNDFAATVIPPDTTTIGPSSPSVTVALVNDSDRTWPAAGPDRVELSARFLVNGTLGGGGVVDEQRWPLPADVPPGGELAATVPLAPTVVDGRYTVLWDVLIDREAYFLQFTGQSAPSVVTVIGSTVGQNPAAEPLRTPRTNLTRPELWRLAADTFVHQPVLGVGPRQLTEATRDQAPEDRRVPGNHAHNLVLEALATTGLAGTIPLVVLLAGGVVGAYRALPRPGSAGRGTDQPSPDNLLAVAILAGLVAHGVHAGVEWQIGEVSPAIPLAVLVGLGWAGSTSRVDQRGRQVNGSV